MNSNRKPTLGTAMDGLLHGEAVVFGSVVLSYHSFGIDYFSAKTLNSSGIKCSQNGRPKS